MNTGGESVLVGLPLTSASSGSPGWLEQHEFSGLVCVTVQKAFQKGRNNILLQCHCAAAAAAHLRLWSGHERI